MFGYLKIDRNELKQKHYLEYRQYYCFVCNSLWDNLGKRWCMLTSYDATFFLMLFDSFETNKELTQLKCPLNPFDKRRFVKINEPQKNYIAFISLLYYYIKLKDNEIDEKKNKYKRKQRIIEHNTRCTRLFSLFPDSLADILNVVETYYKSEAESILSFDNYMNIMGDLFGKVFLNYSKIANTKVDGEAFYKIGSLLGKWIYLVDAFDDLNEDIKNESFNPIMHMTDYKELDYNNLCDKIVFISKCITQNIYYELNKITIINHKEVIYNILQYGMDKSLQSIIRKRREIDGNI